MTEPKPFASLTPCLLARKGGARPAMRPQLGPLHVHNEATARRLDEDLGWNDMGHDAHEVDSTPAAKAQPEKGAVVALTPAAAPVEAPVEAAVPEVVRQQQRIAEATAATVRPRRSALAEGRRAAFTLRLDAERHLKLRLACTVDNRSAQQILTEALDRMIAELPALDALAEQVRKRR